MKLLLKILFFVLAIFQANIGEAKVVVFDNVFSETLFAESILEIANESNLILR